MRTGGDRFRHDARARLDRDGAADPRGAARAGRLDAVRGRGRGARRASGRSSGPTSSTREQRQRAQDGDTPAQRENPRSTPLQSGTVESASEPAHNQMAISTTVQVTLPAMGESVTEGTVLEWHKAEGDHVDADETLVEISTDKVDAEVPASGRGNGREDPLRRGRHRHGRRRARGDPACDRAHPATADSHGGSAVSGASATEGQTAPAEAADEAGEIVDIVTPGRRRVGHRGDAARVARRGRHDRRRRRHDRRDLDRQGRRRAARAGDRRDHRAARRRGRHRDRRPGDRAHGGGRRPASAAAGAGRLAMADGSRRVRRPPPAATPDGMQRLAGRCARRRRRGRRPRAGQRQRAGRAHRRRPTFSPPATAREPRSRGRSGDSRSAAARRCSPSTWTRAARSRPRPRSARSPSRDGRAPQAAQGRRAEGLVHAPDRVRDREGRDRRSMPVMAHHFEEQRRQAASASTTAQVNLGIAVDVEKKDGSRTLMVPVIRDAGPALVRRVQGRVRRADRQGARRTRSPPTTSSARTSR